MQTRVVDNIPEWRFQAEVIARLHAIEAETGKITCAGDMNRGQRSRRQQLEAKVTGLTAGEPDVRIYMTGGRLLSIELKTPRGSRSKAQKARHVLLVGLGFEVVTATGSSPETLADDVERMVRERLNSSHVRRINGQCQSGNGRAG